MKRPIIILPSLSLATRLTWRSGVHLATWMKDEHGLNPVVLNGVWARKWPLYRALQQGGKPAFISYYGHGFADSLVGSEVGARLGRRLITTSPIRPVDRRIIEELRGSVFVTLACLSLKELGDALIAQGVGAFTGSTKPMRIGVADVNKDSQDDFVDLFTLIPRRLVEGATVASAVSEFKAMGEKYAGLCEGAEKCPQSYSKAMRINADNYDFVGDGSLRVVEERTTPSQPASPPTREGPGEAPPSTHAVGRGRVVVP